ncbi:hypothetical protein BaRGS_00015731 [Batillaria attramentaria]|uniref:Uncharacterized protein n=1 Tax=Batillaria attramentaria TaxID=370345 RepID=A0ABD0L0E0_9CAEN
MADKELDRFMKESSRSYKECKVKNSARRNSLMKKTLGIEVERRMATAELSREEKQLREQLKHMQIERTKTTIVSSMRDRANSKSKQKKTDGVHRKIPSSDLDPYPVTFGGNMPNFRSRSNTLDEKGRQLAAKRGRRQSREFEDLHINTATGKLAIPRLVSLGSGSTGVPSPYSLSPSTPRRPFHGSTSSVDSNGDSHWQGDPEAIGSVRRPRKSVEEQESERAAKKAQATEARMRPE